MANAPSTTTTSTWAVDSAHTLVEFAVRHMMITTVKGRFGAVSGTVELDEADPAQSRLEVEIDATSIDTRNDQRDVHLRSADFFDVENHPKLRFVSREVEKVDDGAYRVKGDLTMRGVTKPIVLDVTETGRAVSPWGTERAGFEATARLDRRAFGLEWNQALEAGGVLVSNDVRISLDVQLEKQAD